MISHRDAVISDLPFIVSVYNSTIPSRMITADTEIVSVESRINWFNEHNATNRPIWIIKYNGESCGWLSLSSFYGRPAFYKTVEISIYLHADFRGKNIGNDMLHKAERFAKQAGIKAIISYVFAHNLASVRLFQKQHYQQWGYLPKIAELDNIDRDLIILGKHMYDT